jgi:hypothetical protein
MKCSPSEEHHEKLGRRFLDPAQLESETTLTWLSLEQLFEMATGLTECATVIELVHSVTESLSETLQSKDFRHSETTMSDARKRKLDFETEKHSLEPAISLLCHGMLRMNDQLERRQLLADLSSLFSPKDSWLKQQCGYDSVQVRLLEFRCPKNLTLALQQWIQC